MENSNYNTDQDLDYSNVQLGPQRYTLGLFVFLEIVFILTFIAMCLNARYGNMNLPYSLIPVGFQLFELFMLCKQTRQFYNGETYFDIKICTNWVIDGENQFCIQEKYAWFDIQQIRIEEQDGEYLQQENITDYSFEDIKNDCFISANQEFFYEAQISSQDSFLEFFIILVSFILLIISSQVAEFSENSTIGLQMFTLELFSSSNLGVVSIIQVNEQFGCLFLENEDFSHMKNNFFYNPVLSLCLFIFGILLFMVAKKQHEFVRAIMCGLFLIIGVVKTFHQFMVAPLLVKIALALGIPSDLFMAIINLPKKIFET